MDVLDGRQRIFFSIFICIVLSFKMSDFFNLDHVEELNNTVDKKSERYNRSHTPTSWIPRFVSNDSQHIMAFDPREILLFYCFLL